MQNSTLTNNPFQTNTALSGGDFRRGDTDMFARSNTGDFNNN